jgi:hypothetical protein
MALRIDCGFLGSDTIPKVVTEVLEEHVAIIRVDVIEVWM